LHQTSSSRICTVGSPLKSRLRQTRHLSTRNCSTAPSLLLYRVRGALSHLLSVRPNQLYLVRYSRYVAAGRIPLAIYLNCSTPSYVDHSYTTLATSTSAVGPATRTNSPLPTFDTMAKTRSNISPDSSLSPPPDDLAVPAENTIVKKTVTRKRKAATKITTVPKRPKTTATVNTTSLEDVRASSDPPLQKEPKESLISSENVEAAPEIVGDEIDLQESDSSSGSAKDEDKIKIMSKPRKKTRKKTKVSGALKELALDPMVKRTEDTPLAVGAHVTGSGG
jgi:hypothetical protein